MAVPLPAGTLPTKLTSNDALRLLSAYYSCRVRPGNAGANTASDHIAVLDQALARIPDAHRHGTDILVRADGAGSAKAFLTHLRSLRERDVDLRFSVGYSITEPVRRAIRSATHGDGVQRCN
ncbi:hypothetical protein [Streptomyces sp. NPDC101455]|uniref:hypothetical protein n=1 Tax=Streptomyces sp. NPDC101455 TaxID=3366142 RepID=UPI00383061CB